MRVMRRSEFLDQPAGTIYAKGNAWYFGGMEVKGETMGDDWACLDPCWIQAESAEAAFDRLDAMLERGTSGAGRADFGRDGCFEPDALFLVFERADLEALRGLVDGALAVCPPGGGA